MNINERLGLLIKHLGFNTHSFSKQLALSSSSTLPNILRDKSRKPSFDVINRILTRFPNVDARWLITGEGEMFMKESNNTPVINDRINGILEYYRYDSGDFIKRTGLHPEEVSSVLKKEANPSDRFLQTLEACFPNINPQWLYYNQGKMFKGRIGSDLGDDNEIGIPYYNVEVTNNKPSLSSPVATIKIRGFEDCNLAVSIWGNSMSPDYNTGDIILCRASSKDLIMYGEAYLVFTEETILARYVKQADNSDHVLLTPANERFDAIQIPKGSILDLYLIKGKIIRSLM